MDRSLRRVAALACFAAVLVSGVLMATACSTGSQESASPPGAVAGPAATPGTAAVPAAPVPPPPPPPRTYTLAAGKVLAVQTEHALSTNAQASGDTFLASLAEPIVEGDWVVAKEGSEVEGLVVVSDKGGKVKGRAALEVSITAITLTDGQRVTVTTALAGRQAKSGQKKDAGTIAVTTGVGLAIGAIAGGGKGAAIGAAAGGAGGTALVLGTKGGPAEIPARTVLRFQVTKPVEIVEKK